MAEKNLSPRQKMINMMYLVLTALLALNVSAEILDAFVKIDKSIRITTENFQGTNEKIYSEFVISEKENPVKTKPWREKADQVNKKSDALYDEIQKLKEKLILTADKEVAEENPESHVKSKSDNNVGGQIMVNEGNGEKLKGLIEDYRDFLISLSDGNEGMINSLNNNLNTNATEGEEGEVPWVTANFEHLPLIAVIALMSKMQSDIRNSQSSVLGYLLTKIKAGEFTFNKIEAIVSSPSNYVMQNQPYVAEVFIAASDSTKAPEIFLTGSETPLKVEGGKGIFTGNTSSIGIKSWGGVIKLKQPGSDEILEFPFKSEYQVGAPSVAISPTKMNVFYIGVENPVDITASGVPAANLNVNMTKGNIRKTGNGKYMVKVKSVGNTTISVSANVGGSTKSLGSQVFRCKTVPDPVATVGGSKGGTMYKNTLVNQRIVKASLANFVFDLSFPVTGFNVSATIKGFTVEERSHNSQITAAQTGIIRKLNPGDKVYFEEIKCKAPDGGTRQLGTISFKLR